MLRQLSLMDHLISSADLALRTLVPGAANAARPSPADIANPSTLTSAEKRHSAGLMRINHTGEVCAQALYQGQALTARLDSVRHSMEQAAAEEIDHLAWCEQRLQQLDSRSSYLNPLFYGLSFAIGAIAGKAGDQWSLGFVAATENQVCEHLQEHLQQLPQPDQPSRAILEQMLVDEQAHGTQALAAGGRTFKPVEQKLMRAMSKIMTKTCYYV